MGKKRLVLLSTFLLSGLLLAVMVAALDSPTVDWQVIAGGGAPATGGDVQINDTIGQPVIGIAANGATSLTSGYWNDALIDAACAAAALPDSSASISGTLDVVLDWLPVDGADSYEVWIGTNVPYFTPGSCGAPDPGLSCNTQPGEGYTHNNALGDPAANYFYYVLSVTGCGAVSPPTNAEHTGAFNFGLAAGLP